MNYEYLHNGTGEPFNSPASNTKSYANSTYLINENIRDLRKILNITQQEFADKIGSKRNTVAKYETAANTPSAAVVSLICRGFNVNEIWLRTGEGNIYNLPSTERERFSSNIAKLKRSNNATVIKWINAIAETPPEELERFSEFMKFFT